MVLPVLSVREIVDGAQCGYCFQRTWLYAILSLEVHAYAVWGVPDAEDLGGLFDLWDRSYAKMPRHAILADLRHLDVVNPSAFAGFVEYFATRAASLRAMISDSCVVVSPSLAGTVAAGFFGITPSPFPVNTTASLEQAGARLKLAQEKLAEYEEVRHRVQGNTDVAANVRRLLEQDLLEPDAAALAKRLGLSQRSMQRKLGDLGTSFSEQLNLARVARAKGLLLQTRESMTQIAFSVGFSSLEHFSRTFRAQVGTNPSAYREALEASDGSAVPPRK
jgi:AraC-like DNA-binding protein